MFSKRDDVNRAITSLTRNGDQITGISNAKNTSTPVFASATKSAATFVSKTQARRRLFNANWALSAKRGHANAIKVKVR